MQPDPLRSWDDGFLPMRRRMGDHLTRFPVEDPPIRFHSAVNQSLVQSVDSLDYSLRWIIGILPKNHAGPISYHDLLNNHGHCAPLNIQSQFLTVQERCIRPQGCPYKTDMFENGVGSPHIHVRLVQAREGRLYRILPRSGGSDNHCLVGKPFFDGMLQGGREFFGD